jgi:RHS repeat-associated protein
VLSNDGKYVELNGDGEWWIPSGRIFFAPKECGAHSELQEARRHFFLPRRYVDPFQNATVVTYDGHDFLPVEVRDAVDNMVRSEIDYRVLSPFLLTDANRNRSEVSYDALGMVVGTAVMGKHSQNAGDSLDGFEPDLDEATILEHLAYPLRHPHAILKLATTRMVYDLFAYARTRHKAQPKPAAVYTLARETHVADLRHNEQTRIQHSFSYSDGFQREIQKKIQAEPGRLVEDGSDVNPRWVGSGWTIFNNKGKPVRRYEPFFSALHAFEFAQIVGVSSILFYDPLQRAIATLHPNHTYEKVVFDPWRQEMSDVNDTVLQADPAQDSDVGGFLGKVPHADYLPTWYGRRIEEQMGREERHAALRTAVHANTPAVTYADSLGRVFLSILHNRFERASSLTDEFFATRTELDIQNNQRSIIDPLGRVAMRYDYDMLKTRLRQISIDAGTRWTLNNVVGKLILSWDSRCHRFRHEYDALHRPTNFYVRKDNHAEILFERTVYGEGKPNDLSLNLRNKPFRQFDGAGISTNEHYDFKGNLIKSTRQLLDDYKNEADWSQVPQLEVAIFAVSTTYDALNRPITLTMPDASVARPKYNEANLLESLSVNVRGTAEPTPFVTYVNYNAKGQREIIDYGNGARTRYTYDPLTFRMINLLTHRKQDHTRLQDLHYTFDPIGNITSIRDDAQEAVYFKNQVVSASSEYVYDAVYRLITADGREHAAKHDEPQTTDDDLPRMNHPLPSDAHALHSYREQYEYDAVGSILELLHSNREGNWVRHYRYDDPDRRLRSNRLNSTQVGQYEEFYSYDADGNMTRMPHLPKMEWDIKDQLHATQRQVEHSGRGETTYYVYDSAGKRVRKVTERGSGSRQHERIYFDSFEIYRRFDSVGAITLERETLHVMDAKGRIALVETKTIGESRRIEEPTSRVRSQFYNHLGSAVLELDGNAAIIAYEEYYPYGSTSFEATDAAAEVSRKRYRYTGKERDEETGLYYLGARYYASWIARWTATDPAGMIDGPDLYAYVRGNPVRMRDPSGKQGEDSPHLELKPTSLLDNRSAAERFAARHAGALGDFHLRLNDSSGGTDIAPWLHPDPNAPVHPSSPSNPDPKPDSGTASSSSKSSKDGPKVTGGVFLPNIQIDTKGFRFKFDVGFTSTKVSLAGDTSTFRGRLGLEYGYGKDLKLSSNNSEGGGSIAVNPQTGVVTFGLQQNLTDRLITSESINTSGAFIGSLIFKFGAIANKPKSPLDDPSSNPGAFITPLRFTPGSGGISPQDTGDPFRAGVNAAQGMLPEVPGVLADPTRIPGFISTHTSVPAGQTESDFTKIGRTVDAAKAVHDLPKSTLDVRLRLDVATDPTYGFRTMLNLQVTGW